GAGLQVERDRGRAAVDRHLGRRAGRGGAAVAGRVRGPVQGGRAWGRALVATGQVDRAAGAGAGQVGDRAGAGGAARLREVAGGDAGDRLAEADVVAERGRLGDVVRARAAGVGAGLQVERDRGRAAVDRHLGRRAGRGGAAVAGRVRGPVLGEGERDRALVATGQVDRAGCAGRREGGDRAGAGGAARLREVAGGD